VTSLAPALRLSLDAETDFGKLGPSHSEAMGVSYDEREADFQYPQREAAFFYGLFLRGHSVEELRRDIAVPAEVLAKWDREAQRTPDARPVFNRIVEYRRHVLAIFESLVGYDSRTQHLQ
jgi:hypothetical protein